MENILQHTRTFSNNGVNWGCGRAYNGRLYLAAQATTPGFFAFDLSTGLEWPFGQINTTGSTNTGSMVIVNGASAVWDTNDDAALNMVELSSGYFQRTTDGTNFTTAPDYHDQTVAWNHNNPNYIAKLGSDSSGSISWLNTTTWAKAKSVSISPTGNQIDCIIPNPYNGNYVIGCRSADTGTTPPQIMEVSWNGSVLGVIKSFKYDTWTKSYPAGMTGQGGSITSMCMPSSTALVIADSRGVVTMFDYTASSVVLDQLELAGSGGSSGGALLSPSASGMFVVASVDSSLPNNHLSVVRTVGNQLQLVEEEEDASQVIVRALGYDDTAQSFYTIASNQWAHNWKCLSPNWTEPVQTRVQNPAGTDVTARVIRIRDLRGVQSYVDSDMTVAAGACSYNVLGPGEYYEIALIGSFGAYQWDWRKFNI